MIWLLFGAVVAGIYTLAIALCRAAAQGDRKLEDEEAQRKAQAANHPSARQS